MALCSWLYNRLLEELNRARSEGRKIAQRETQGLIVGLKRERLELRDPSVGLGRSEQTPVEIEPLLSVPAQSVVAGKLRR